MQVCSSLIRDHYTFRLYDRLSDIDPKVWDHIVENIPFYQTHAFLSLTERIHPEISFRYALIYRAEQAVAAVYVQRLDFSYRNLVNYSGEQGRGIKARFKRFISGKNTFVLNLGNVFFTGDKGILAEQETEIIPLIPEIFAFIRNSFKENKPSASLVANVYLQDEDKCLSFCRSKFHPFITEPDMFMKVNGRWNSFGEYMDSLSSKYRVRAKKVLSLSAKLKVKVFSADEIKDHRKLFQDLYSNVVNHVAFNMATLNVDFFEEVKRLYGPDCTVFVYCLDHQPVGFACLFHVDPGVLHIHYIGLDYEVNREMKLYNRMLLDFVQFAIERRAEHIHFGRTATEIKTTIGAEPRPLQAYLKMHNPLVNASLPYFLSRIKPAEYAVRNPFKE